MLRNGYFAFILGDIANRLHMGSLVGANPDSNQNKKLSPLFHAPREGDIWRKQCHRIKARSPAGTHYPPQNSKLYSQLFLVY
jgi:hypothetical protein